MCRSPLAKQLGFEGVKPFAEIAAASPGVGRAGVVEVLLSCAHGFVVVTAEGRGRSESTSSADTKKSAAAAAAAAVSAAGKKKKNKGKGKDKSGGVGVGVEGGLDALSLSELPLSPVRTDASPVKGEGGSSNSSASSHVTTDMDAMD